MHDFSRFSCLLSGVKALLFTEAGVKVTDVILLLPAGVKVCLWVFMGVMGINRCLWVFMGLWMFIGIYGDECL